MLSKVISKDTLYVGLKTLLTLGLLTIAQYFLILRNI